MKRQLILLWIFSAVSAFAIWITLGVPNALAGGKPPSPPTTSMAQGFVVVVAFGRR